MRSAALPGIESSVVAAIGNGYLRLSRAARKSCKHMAAVLRAKRDERYVMSREHLLRGPLADEFRRAWWL